jgi:hypothetical protein
MTNTATKRTVYDVVQHTFGNLPQGETPEGTFRPRTIATCASRALAQGVIARNNNAFHRFEIVEREAKGGRRK